MKPALVIFHVFYTEQIPYFIGKLKNIAGTEWDLIVTGDLSDAQKAELSEFKKGTRFLHTENIGYDIWPFIAAVKSVNLSKYSFVIKLHTKNVDTDSTMRLNGRYLRGSRWRDTMVDALLKSPEAFKRVAGAFEDRNTGLVFSMGVCTVSRGGSIEDSSLLADELDRLGIVPSDKRFCAGTIFAARAEALEYLRDERINVNVFPPSGASHSVATITHSYERILSLAITAQGYGITLIPESIARTAYMKCKEISQPFLEWLFSINRFGDNNDKFLTILGIRRKLPGRSLRRKGR